MSRVARQLNKISSAIDTAHIPALQLSVGCLPLLYSFVPL
jgi:hypothetical protein